MDPALRRSPFRLVVTTDPELDDLNSMLRLLLYSNEIDIAGLVYSASQFHHAGDPGLGVEPHRWPAPGETLHIDQAIDAYAEVAGTLVGHDPRYPSADYLRSLVRMGNVRQVGDLSEPTPGSDLVAEVLLDPDERPVFVQAWGGLNTIARALESIEETHGASEAWPAIRSRIGLQDDTFLDYIRPRWPELEHREVATRIWGYLARDAVRSEDAHFLSAEWTRANVSTVGPIGHAYRVWGDGKQMANGFDHEDYFGIAEPITAELETAGYWVWMPPQPRGAWISEGDSSNFALLIDNGLRSWEDPTYGGWGGRQAPNPDDARQWSSSFAHDAAPDGTTPLDFAAARWFAAVQNDFAARLRWSVTSDVASANHHPTLTITEGLAVTAAPGSAIALHAVVADPDGDDVFVSWWQYREAGTCPLVATIEAGDDAGAVVHVPAGAEPGQTIHVIAEATDNGEPPLTSYQRVVVTVG